MLLLNRLFSWSRKSVFLLFPVILLAGCTVYVEKQNCPSTDSGSVLCTYDRKVSWPSSIFLTGFVGLCLIGSIERAYEWLVEKKYIENDLPAAYKELFQKGINRTEAGNLE